VISKRRNADTVDDLVGKPTNQDAPPLTFINTSTLEVEKRFRIDLSDRSAVKAAHVIVSNLQLGLRVDLSVFGKEKVLAVLHSVGLLRSLADGNGAIEHAFTFPGKHAFIQLAARSMRFSVLDLRMVIDMPLAIDGK
jgi:hypothetical protein